MAVVAIESRLPVPSCRLPVLADAFQAVRISLRHCAVLQFIDNLRVAGWVLGVDQVLRGHARNSFAHAVAVAVVNNRYPTLRHQMILEVVRAGCPGRRDRVPVRIVLV